MTWSVVSRQSLREIHATLPLALGEPISAALKRLKALLLEHEAHIVRQEVFGPLAAQAATVREMHSIFGAVNWPLCWVEGPAADERPTIGMHFLAVAGTTVHQLRKAGSVVGTFYEAPDGCHCFITGLMPAAISASPASQTKIVYDELAAILSQANLDLSHLTRTWFFLDDILAWYDEFNAVRNQLYNDRSLTGRLVPASTAVGGKNGRGAALTASAWAVKSRSPVLSLQAVPSPLQCPALSYGSCFSRALEISQGDVRQLLISGTASIEPGGASAHPNDISAQMELTMRVVEAILSSREMTFRDIARATAYVRHAADVPLVGQWCAKRNLNLLPLVATSACICRHELLFELELDAVSDVRSKQLGIAG